MACAATSRYATFFARNQGEKKYSLETARQNIQDRLSFADDVGAKYGSMLAFPATEQQLEANQGFDTVMSVTSRLLPWELTGPSARDHSSFPGGQKVYEQYEKELGLSGIHYGEDMKAAGSKDFISQGSDNAIAAGPHRGTTFTKSFMSLVPGQGRFGPDAIPETRAGAGGPSASKRPGIRWSRSSSHSTPRWCTRSRKGGASTKPNHPKKNRRRLHAGAGADDDEGPSVGVARAPLGTLKASQNVRVCVCGVGVKIPRSNSKRKVPPF